MHLEIGDFLAGVRQLGLPAAFVAFFLVVSSYLGSWVSSDDVVLVAAEKECAVCANHGAQMVRVCSPGYLITSNPPNWMQPFGQVPQSVAPKTDALTYLREHRYLTAKNWRECKERISHLSFVIAGFLLPLMPICVIVAIIWRRWQKL